VSNSKRESHWVLRAQVGDREALDSLLRSIQVPIAAHTIVAHDFHGSVASETAQLHIHQPLPVDAHPGHHRRFVCRLDWAA